MDILLKKVFKFDIDNLRVAEIALADEPDDFTSYLDELIENVIGDERSKRYAFPDHATNIKHAITSIIAKDYERPMLDTARQLLRIEQNVQRRIEHLDTEVQKGIMLQSVVEYNGQKLFLIIKAEHSDFINESDNRKATGLPIKKKIFKSFCAYHDAEGNLTYANVSDYKSKISEYWWSTFLELEEVYTNEYNTERAFNALERKIFNRIKERHPEDYMSLRNSTVQYFRANEQLVWADYCDQVFNNYIPEDESLNIEHVRDQARELPEREKFDARFTVVRSMIKKKIIKNVKLTPQLELVIKEDIDWQNTVRSFKDDNGVKYIRIKTDKGYDYFPKDGE